jgi:hypothetical protein
MKKADKMFEKLGYTKAEENNIIVVYTKPIPEYGYIHTIEFCHKARGNHHVSSYEEGVNKDGFSNSVALTIPEIKAIRRKFKELKW